MNLHARNIPRKERNVTGMRRKHCGQNLEDTGINFRRIKISKEYNNLIHVSHSTSANTLNQSNALRYQLLPTDNRQR